MARSKSDIPSAPDQLTTRWLTTAMRASGAIGTDVTVTGFTIRPIHDAGTGLSGETVVVDFVYAPAGAGPTSAVAKFPTSDIVNRGMIESTDSYAREIAFYQDLVSEVPVAAPKHLGSECDPGQSEKAAARSSALLDKLSPKVHLAVTKDITKFMKASKRRYALLIEDLGPNARVHDIVDPPDAAGLAQILDALAKVHAHFWGRTDLLQHRSTRPLCSQIPRVFENVFTGRSAPSAMERWSSWLTDDHRAVLEESGRRHVADVALINEPMTLVHGDPRSDNMLFMPSGELVIVDWALPGFGHPGYDVGYLLGSSIEDFDLAVELVEGYHAALRGEGVELDAQELWKGFYAMLRAEVVLQVNGLDIFTGDYGGQPIADIWAPRSIKLLTAAGAAGHSI